MSAKSTAYAYATLPPDDKIIGNLYNGDGKFSKENLDALAQAVNYSDIDNMIAEVSKLDATDPNARAKTSADFGDTVVKFGKFTNKTTKQEEDLVWIPTYLSKSTTGEPILTLWLAITAADNTTVSDQEVSYFAEGTAGAGGYNTNASTNPSSNNYSTSYIRSVALNNGTKYVSGYNNSDTKQTVADGTLTEVQGEQQSDNKFAMFTMGDLAEYIVEPKNVDWQANAGYLKNDPMWTGGSTTTYPDMGAWLNDKLWLPSVHEVFDEAPSPSAYPFTVDDGLWKTDSSKRKNTQLSLLRSCFPDNSYVILYATANGNTIYYLNVNYTRTVRPALHLNLSKAAEDAVPNEPHVSELQHTAAQAATCTNKGNIEYWHCAPCDKYYSDAQASTEITDITTITTELDSANHSSIVHHAAEAATCTEAGNPEYWECTGCKKYFSDEGATTELAADKIVIEALGHDYSEAWKKDDTNHWHECTRDPSHPKDSVAPHTWDSGTETKAADCVNPGTKQLTCTTCCQTKTETIPVKAHTLTKQAAVLATCTATGKKEHYKCSSCNKLFSDDKGTTEWSESDLVTAKDPTNHDFAATYSKNESNHWYECSRCHEKGEEAAHTWNDGTETKAADCVNPGTKEYTCTVCGQTKTEEIPALGHNYEAVDGGTPPTCTTPGSGKVKCSRCGDVKEGDSIPALGHNYATTWSKDETNHWHECTRDPAHPKDSLAAHDWDNGQITSQPTSTAKGVKTFTCNTCGQTRTEEFAAGENKITAFNPTGWTYGDTPATHTATATFGTPTITYSDTIDGTYVATKPTEAGTYWVKAEVTADPNGIYPAAVEKKSFTIAKRAITVTINAASSEEGQELEALTATITSGTIAAGDTNVYALSTTANKDSINSYPITGTCLNDNYNITFVNGVYIVSKRAEDPNGGGTIDLPTDANVEFKVTQSKTGGDYSQLDGMKVGYWAQLWERNADGTLGDEYTDSLNCVLTLKIPNEIIEAIRGGEEIDRNKIADGLGVYYVTDGGMEKVNAFTIAQREDESWIIKFNYNSKFRAEVVFNAENYEEPAEEPEKAGIPWWVWLIVGIGGATLITIIIVAIVLAKKKSANGNAPAPAPTPAPAQGEKYDDAEVRAQLAEQRKLIDELANRDDGGFNDVYKGE